MWRHAPDRAVWQWLIDGVPVAETSWMMLISADRGDMHRWLAVIEAGLPPGPLDTVMPRMPMKAGD